MNVSSALARQAVVPVRCRAGKGTPGRARKTLRRARTSKEPSGSDAAEEGGISARELSCKRISIGRPCGASARRPRVPVLSATRGVLACPAVLAWGIRRIPVRPGPAGRWIVLVGHHCRRSLLPKSYACYLHC